MKVNIAVLNYNGKELLQKYLPSIIESANASKFKPKVTVLDNKSTDSSVEFIRTNFPAVNIYIAKENKIYCSYNEFFKTSDDDIIIILNSDIKTDVNFVDSLIENFINNPQVFLVASKMYFLDAVTYQGDKSIAKEHFGVISADTRFDGYKKLIDKKDFTFSAGNGAFDRKKVVELGGFDEIYLPGRYEDVDLCFRAWKSGYVGIYEPKSVIFHEGYGSFKKEFKDKQIQSMVLRNSIFFTLKNIKDPFLLLKFFTWLPIRLIYFTLTAKFYLLKGFFEAFIRFSEIKNTNNNYKLTDRQVLNIIGKIK